MAQPPLHSRVPLGDASVRANASSAGPKPVTGKPTTDPKGLNRALQLPQTAPSGGPTSGSRLDLASTRRLLFPPQDAPPSAPAAVLPAAAPAAPPKPTAGQKRKAPAAARSSLKDDIEAYKRNLDDVCDPDDIYGMDLPSCNMVRGRINRLIDAGIMTKTEFCRAIGSNTNSLARFLQQTGSMAGSGSNVYINAWTWFKQRELAGLKMPDVKKRQKTEAGAAAAAAGKGGGGTGLPDISGVYLAGEEEDDVWVYESCDEVRRKINAHLKTPGLTAAQFCRDLYAQLRRPRCKAIQSKQLADFRGGRGARTGARSTVYYAAYVYFEKLRLALRKPRSEHRKAMEELWPGGFDRTVDHNTSYIFLNDGFDRAFDEFGLLRKC
ncbi:hypothetical protein F4780DRAFT_738039 [Xylariomycetidae sp. FL0641]|nr:hypothetical protein F4780DRAFT_738039 [Xylariomycetidae sp. FL0641]